MPKSSTAIAFRNLFTFLLFLPLALACRQDEPFSPAPPPPEGGGTAQMTLSVRIPGFREAVTRAGVYEEAIQDITVLLIADEGGTEKVMKKFDVPYTSLHGLSGSPDTKVFSVPVAAGTYRRIALVANARTELAGITEGVSTYENLKQVQVTGRFGQAGRGADSYIPMYGEHAPSGGIRLRAGVSQTIAQAVPLIRSMARVDIINSTTSGAGTIAEKVYFVNSVGNGIVWVNPISYNTTASESSYMNPTLPGTLQPAVSGGHALEGMAGTGSPLITYYLNEQPATSGGSRPCIVLPLDYQGRQYYYRLDYTWDGIKGGGASPYEKGKYMPILRNHRYVFTIREVKGPGFSTVEEALGSPENHTNLHNIVVTPVVVDEAFTDITYNDMGHFLAVTRTAMTLKGRHDNTSTQNGFSVRTNYPGGYRIEARNADGTGLPSTDPWLRPSRGSGAAGATLASPVTEPVQAITSGMGKYKGYLEVRAGRLYTKVNVEQIWKLPLEYVAEFNLAGGAQYGAKSNNPSLVTSAQTDADLRWATSHDNDQSGYYNWYVCKGTYDATYNPSTKNLFSDVFFTPGHPGHGYHLPSRWELTSVFSYNYRVNYSSSVNYSNINEACEFGGIKKTFANDYSSPGNGTCYALRFKKATGAPDDGSSLTDFPQATDNSMLCAYRYRRVGSLSGNNNTDHLEIDCVYLGEAGASMPITTISNDSWWSARASETVTRIFPATGSIYPAAVSGSGTLYYRGHIGDYWSGTEYASARAWRAYFNSNHALAGHWGNKYSGYAVRLFASE
ncbi:MULTISPECIES: hypothetical protein [unclassified Bacteroides]|uniref:hypothetical protein n=1 Tax=unclassified Bacteroides TaxID=2646097 RepID=UPI004063F551